MPETMSDADRDALVAEARETFGENAARELRAQFSLRGENSDVDDSGGHVTAENVVAFPGKVVAIGKPFRVDVVRLGRERAERRGIAVDRIEAALSEDRCLATYLLGLLGSDDAQDRTAGEVGLRRLTEDAPPDTAA